MPQINKQPLAEQDLINIWLYTFKRWGEIQADKYLDELEQGIKLLASQPLLCRQRDEFNPAVRVHHYAYHLIIYITSNDTITIVRVLHESMDIETQLSE